MFLVAVLCQTTPLFWPWLLWCLPMEETISGEGWPFMPTGVVTIISEPWQCFSGSGCDTPVLWPVSMLFIWSDLQEMALDVISCLINDEQWWWWRYVMGNERTGGYCRKVSLKKLSSYSIVDSEPRLTCSSMYVFFCDLDLCARHGQPQQPWPPDLLYSLRLWEALSPSTC